jgi:hypothetical protein
VGVGRPILESATGNRKSNDPYLSGRATIAVHVAPDFGSRYFGVGAGVCCTLDARLATTLFAIAYTLMSSLCS